MKKWLNVLTLLCAIWLATAGVLSLIGLWLIIGGLYMLVMSQGVFQGAFWIVFGVFLIALGIMCAAILGGPYYRQWQFKYGDGWQRFFGELSQAGLNCRLHFPDMSMDIPAGSLQRVQASWLDRRLQWFEKYF